MLDFCLPPSVKRKRLTQARVAAVCEQLGDHVSTRNVQMILGGSLRDIGPLIQQWREKRTSQAENSAGSSEQVQAMGAIVLCLMQDHISVISKMQDQAFRRVEGSLKSVSDRLEALTARIAKLEALHDQTAAPKWRTQTKT